MTGSRAGGSGRPGVAWPAQRPPAPKNPRWWQIVAAALVLTVAGCGQATDPDDVAASTSTVATSEPGGPTPSSTRSTGRSDPTATPPASPPPSRTPTNSEPTTTLPSSGPTPGPVVTVESVEPLPDDGIAARLRPGTPVAVAPGVVAEVVSLAPADPECDDCVNRAVVVLEASGGRQQADMAVGGGMAPNALEAARRLRVGSWLLRIEGFGPDHVDVTIHDVG